MQRFSFLLQYLFAPHLRAPKPPPLPSWQRPSFHTWLWPSTSSSWHVNQLCGLPSCATALFARNKIPSGSKSRETRRAALMLATMDFGRCIIFSSNCSLFAKSLVVGVFIAFHPGKTHGGSLAAPEGFGARSARSLECFLIAPLYRLLSAVSSPNPREAEIGRRA